MPKHGVIWYRGDFRPYVSQVPDNQGLPLWSRAEGQGRHGQIVGYIQDGADLVVVLQSAAPQEVAS